MPKIYFEDTGLMNILKLYDFPKEIDGALFENSIYNLLRKIADIDALYYWRTTHGQEVDFVIENINKLIANICGQNRIVISNDFNHSKKYFILTSYSNKTNLSFYSPALKL